MAIRRIFWAVVAITGICAAQTSATATLTITVRVETSTALVFLPDGTAKVVVANPGPDPVSTFVGGTPIERKPALSPSAPAVAPVKKPGKTAKVKAPVPAVRS